MGYPRGAYWFSWILNQMIVQLVVVAIQVWLVFLPFDTNTGALIRYGDGTLWFCVLVMFNFSSMSFFTFTAAFFRRGTYISSDFHNTISLTHGTIFTFIAIQTLHVIL